jgi:hypothetical protein
MANSQASKGVLLSGAKAVTSAGTAEAIASSGLFNHLVIHAKPGNTGQVYIGGSDVASSTNGGLNPGDTVTFSPNKGHPLDLTDIYLDVDTSGEGVNFYASI